MPYSVLRGQTFADGPELAPTSVKREAVLKRHARKAATATSLVNAKSARLRKARNAKGAANQRLLNFLRLNASPQRRVRRVVDCIEYDFSYYPQEDEEQGCEPG